MADISTLYQTHKDLSLADQKKAGLAQAGAMGDEHTQFVQTISRMIVDGSINVYKLETFFHPGAYEALNDVARAQVDVSVLNIADLLRHIAAFYVSKATPDSSPQLSQMIEELWQMKDRLEKKFGDILKF